MKVCERIVSSTYTYNAAGNRTTAVLKGVSCTYTTPATHNRLASWTGGGGMAYNTEGCVTQLNRANKVDISSLSWNAEYQLTGTTVGGVTVSYTYDVLGRKASRAAGANTEYYIYDGIDLVAEMDGAGNVVRTYTYGPGVDDILAMTIHGSSGTTNYYYLKDLANTVLALANSSGLIVESYDYDAYGNVTIKNSGGSVISTSAYGNRFLFQGREYDYTTQLYHFRARWYDPETGRWLSNDPIGISGGLNLYAFCSNDPVNFVDPRGTYSKNKQGVIRISYELENGESEVKYLYIIKDFVEFFRKVDPNNKITWMKITAHGLKTSPGTILLGDGLISDLNHQYCGEPEGTLGIKNENISSCFANAFSPNADIILKACFGADLAYSINSIRNDLNVVGYTGIVHAPLGILKFAAWGYGKVTY